MPDHDRFLWVYFQLARISDQKSQLIPRDKFLVLTAVEACKAGYLEIANRCHSIIVKHNPNHLLKNYPDFADAMRDDDFTHFEELLNKRFCNREQAEHLLYQAQDESLKTYEQPDDSVLATEILQEIDQMESSA